MQLMWLAKTKKTAEIDRVVAKFSKRKFLRHRVFAVYFVQHTEENTAENRQNKTTQQNNKLD